MVSISSYGVNMHINPEMLPDFSVGHDMLSLSALPSGSYDYQTPQHVHKDFFPLHVPVTSSSVSTDLLMAGLPHNRP